MRGSVSEISVETSRTGTRKHHGSHAEANVKVNGTPVDDRWPEKRMGTGPAAQARMLAFSGTRPGSQGGRLFSHREVLGPRFEPPTAGGQRPDGPGDHVNHCGAYLA